MKKKHRVLWVLLAVLLSFALWVFWTNTHFTTTRLTIQNEKLPADFAGFKIAHISDLHNHDWGPRLAERIQKEQPDIIAITGDFVDSSHTDFDISMRLIEQLKSTAPIYYVTGNHEAWLESYPELAERLKAAGVHMMDDKAETLQRGGSQIGLAGIQDPDFAEQDWFGGVQQSIVTEKLEPLLDETLYNIVLCHRPELLEGYAQAQADLVLTGHAHGGQVRIPFVGGLIAPNQGLFPKYTEGVHHQGSTDMVVSRGLGNSIIPVRINNTPELVMLTLQTKPAG